MTRYPDFPSISEAPEEILTIFNLSGMKIPLRMSDFKALLHLVEQSQKISFSEIELVYVDADQIIDLNREHLNRDYVTDIITFGYNEPQDEGIEGTLYCCAQRIAEQSKELNVETETEFSRVFVHGLLHLAGLNDTSEQEEAEMRSQEDLILQMRARDL